MYCFYFSIYISKSTMPRNNAHIRFCVCTPMHVIFFQSSYGYQIKSKVVIWKSIKLQLCHLYWGWSTFFLMKIFHCEIHSISVQINRENLKYRYFPTGRVGSLVWMTECQVSTRSPFSQWYAPPLERSIEGMKPAICLEQFLLNSYPSTPAPTLCGAAGQGVLPEVLSSLCCHLV